jgi:hypothetical protein
MKRYKIILECTGSTIVDAESEEEAVSEFYCDVTGDELLQMISISAEEV